MLRLLIHDTIDIVIVIFPKVEYIIVKFDDENQRATVSLRADELLPKLQEKEMEDPQSKFQLHKNLIILVFIM